MNIPVPDNGIPVRSGDSSYVYKNVYHPIVWINNLPYRPRVETLIIKDGTMVYLHLKNGKGSSGIKGEYELPGGSIDADSSKLKQAENEINEESLMSVKDIYDTGIQYYENYPDGFIMGGGDTPLEYKGHISDVFVAQYSGIYDKKSVEKKDLDPKIANNGKFYKIMDIAKLLKQEHYDAILNCPYVNSSTKASLRILSQMMNSMSKTNLKDISSSEITDTLIIVSPHGKLTQIPVSSAGKEKDWKKISVFRSVKNAVEDFFTTMNGKLLRHQGNYANKILYVYTVDDPRKELSIYTPSNEEAPCGKVTGEIWLKSSLNNIPIKRLGMIQTTSTGKSSQFYSGIRNSNVYNVPEYTFKWIVRDIVENAVAESASPIVPGNKLYHGTTYEISKFEPRSLNLGNAMEEPSWVTFAFADYTLALRFGLMRAIQKAKDYWGKDILCSWDISETKPYISAEDFNKVNDLIQGFKFFVYTIDATNLNVGIGNDDRLPEYTFNESGIIPEKEDILRIDSAMMREHLIIVPDAEFKEYKKNQETMAKYEHPRGWYGAFITRDYDNGDASHKLQAATQNGNLKPGDDIREYMNTHGISFEDDSVSLSSVNESIYYRVTYDGIGIYDAVKSSVDRKTWINLLNDDAVTWLPKPPQYMLNNKSYFTKAGYDMFTRRTLPLLKNYVDPRKIQVSTIDDIEKIVYEDNYQIVVSEAVNYGNTPMKSTLKKNFKKKAQLTLSSFRRLKINQSVVNKYKHKTKALQNMEPTEGGYVFVDGEEFVAAVVVDNDRSGTGDLKDYNWITYIEVDKKYQGCGLSRQLLDIAVKELKGDFLTVTYDNEVAINLYKSYGFKITKSSYDAIRSGKSKSKMYTMFYHKHAPDNIEFVNESFTPVGSHNMYFLSDSDMDGETLQPRIPNNFLVSNGYEDGGTKRICFATSIDNALMGLSQNLKGKEFFVHMPAKGVNGANIISPSSQQVPDASITGEIWYTKPVELKCVGKIMVTDDDGQPGKPYTYGNHTAKLYGWNWEWVDSPKNTNMHMSQPVTESLFISKGVFDVNFEDFESGKSNVVLITGLSGSGKTTLGTKIANEYNAELIELDCFECCYQFETDEQLREAGEVFWQYLSKRKVLWDKLKERSIRGKELGEEINKFVRFAIPWCKSDTKTKYVIEGVQIYSFLNKEKISGTPLLIVGTSALKSLVQRLGRVKRENSKEEFKHELSELPQCITWYLDDNKKLEKFKKSVLESAGGMEPSISYSKNKDHVVEIIDSLPMSEKKFIGNHVDDGFSKQFVSHTKNLKYREVLLVDKEPVAFLDVYTMPDMANNEGTIVLTTKNGSKYRRKGYGSMLVERMEKCITQKTGITKLTWEYDKENIKSGMMGITHGYKGLTQKLSKTLECELVETYVSEAAEYSSTNKYPVFITLMHTGTATATFIKKMTGDEFSHATISFNMRLSPQYSFGTKKLGGKERGLVIHGTGDPFYDQFKTTYATYVMYVSKQQREKMLTRLQWFIDHEETLKYDTPALAACFLHIPTEFRKKYFCSRFVMEIIGEGQELSKVPSLWKPQEIAYLNNITLVNAGDDFRHYDYKVTQTNLNLIKENRQNEIYVDIPVSESTRSELPDDAFGLPEHRKYPLDTEKHVKSAIKFFNYVSKDDEKELAQNILRRMDELGMGKPTVSERNRFIKYVQESYQQILETPKNYANWSLIDTLDGDERKKVLKVASPYVNSPVVYVNNAFVGKELVGTINVFRDHDKENFGHIFITKNPKFTDFHEINEDLLHEAQVELTDPIWGISSYEVNYPENQSTIVNSMSENPVQESCRDVRTAREFLQKVDKLGEKYDANFFIVTDGASMTRNNRGSNPAVQHCRNAQKEWERKNGFDPDEDWSKDGTLESVNIAESGCFDEYAKYTNLDDAEGYYNDPVVFEEAIYSEETKYPVFILLTRNNDPRLQPVYAKVMGDEYNHIDIAFDPELNQLYTITTSGVDKSVRSWNHPIYKQMKTSFELHVMYVTIEQHTEIVTKINNFVRGKSVCSYDWGAVASLISGKLPKSQQNKWVCSSFIAHVLGKDDLLQKSPEMWHPQKMVSTFNNISLVNMGDDLSKYNSSITKRNLELVKRGEYSSIVLENRLDLGLLSSETWIPLMEAPKAIDKDSTGDSADDYTSDVEEPESDTTEDSPNTEENDDTTDYTNDVEEPEEEPDDDEPKDTGSDDDNTNSDDALDDLNLEEPTDYTDGAEGESEESENTDGEDTTSSDSTDTDNTDKSGNLFDNNVLKNYSLLRNFEKLYELIKEVSDSLDAKVEPTKLQNMVLAQVLKNLNSIKEFIISYVKFQFSQDNYSQNLYYYKIVVQSLKLNLELLKRNRLLSESK